MPKYECVRGLDVGGKRYEPGDTITLPDSKSTKHLLAKGAIRKPSKRKAGS